MSKKIPQKKKKKKKKKSGGGNRKPQWGEKKGSIAKKRQKGSA